jgi:hypothetical protein
MNTPKSNATAARPAAEDRPSRTPETPVTPSADMQPEDAGTAASGNANSGSPAAPVMKQFAKTGHERGGRE